MTRSHDHYADEEISSALKAVRTIAMLGASPNPVRPSYGVMRFLLSKGYELFPVNPGQAGKEILGRMTYATLADIPVPIDMVDVFRAPEHLPAIVDEVLKLQPLPKYLWGQLSVRNDDAAATAEKAGLTVIMDRCPAIEYPRLIG